MRRGSAIIRCCVLCALAVTTVVVCAPVFAADTERPPELGPAFAPEVPTIDALGEIPASCDIVVSVENATLYRDTNAGRGLVELLRGLGFTASLDASWPGLARELDLSPEQAFDALLGRRAILAIRSGDGAERPTEFAFLTEVNRETEARLRRMLRPAPRGLEVGFPILTIEGGRYEIAASEVRGEGEGTATVVIAPSGVKLFDELVVAVQREREGPKLRDTKAWKVTRDRAGKAPVLGVVAFGGGVDERYAGFAGWPGENGWRVQFAAGSVSIERFITAPVARTLLPSWLTSPASPVFAESLFASAGSLSGLLPEHFPLLQVQRGFQAMFLGELAPPNELGAPVAFGVFREALPSEAAVQVAPIEVLMAFAAADASDMSAALDARMGGFVRSGADEAPPSSLGAIRTGDLLTKPDEPERMLKSVLSWTVRPQVTLLPEMRAPGWCGVTLGHRMENARPDTSRIQALAKAMTSPAAGALDPRGEVVFRASVRPSELPRIFPGDLGELAVLTAIEKFDASAWIPADGRPVLEGEIEIQFVPPVKQQPPK